MARLSHVKHGQIIGVGVGHEKKLAVRRQTEAIRRVSDRRLGIKRTNDGFPALPGLGVDDTDLGGIGTGDKQSFSIWRLSHLRRMALRLP